MSNITVFNAAQAPSFAKKGELSATAKALIGSAGGGSKRISIKGGVFRLINAGKEIAAIEERFLDVVIATAAPKISRVFYLKSYDADAVSGPDCWSQNGDVPSPESVNKQAPNCAGCAQNIAGSGQGTSRACRYQQRVAVVLANDVEGDVLQLTVPAASFFGKADGDNRPLQEYARWLAAQGISPEAVVTRMRFDTKAESPKLLFKVMRWLTDDEYEVVTEKAASEEATRAITMTVAKMDSAPEPAKLEGKPPVKAKAAAAPPPVENDEEEAPPPPPKRGRLTKAKEEAAPQEEVAEPEVRKEAPKKPVVGGRASLADMVSDWDDE